MADVLIVCVREDEPQAKALAEMFEAAGFSIGGAPSSDSALRSSGAGVVVWSQASIRSRPFLDAAQRVINADKAVVASLIEPPPPSSIGSSPAFDLTHWEGDPNDPALDPLFFAVDRMVNAARASVGASASRADAYDRPAPPRPARASPASATPLNPPSADRLGSEAEHWRAIRDSRDPADYMDYLSKYGPNGDFAEVAELRLKQLTAGDQGPRVRGPTPLRQRAEPQRREPLRRPDALPPTTPRRAEQSTRRMPPPDRTFDRAELREPPKGQGGVLRAFVLVVLLGGALAGGLYFGGGFLSDSSAPAVDASSEPLDAPGSVPLGEEPGDAGLFAESDAARAPPAPPPARREPPAARETAASAPASAPPSEPPASINFGSPSGPVSLSPGSAGSPGTEPVPLAPPLSTAPAGLEAASTPPPQRPPAAVGWAQRPSARRIADLYPDRALRQGVGGRVQLDCTVQPNLSVICTILSETPPGLGFGSAALSASGAYRAQPRLSDGASAIGARTRIAVSFQAPQ